ncbi:hypothetical protein FQ775_12365 [Nitratireductor mangrovi]|uniref:Uncharacterized protein n=1 Tax=Nitratireductor mangrovi TaxID=2599600 RepID=A0A5B8KZT9_9HYPH|nr:hypothetical protein [Nitratireductor mangrovi]QDZ01106.1 hypothetical protein FQ775_12365 [Nitratireductor mangrovi]
MIDIGIGVWRNAAIWVWPVFLVFLAAGLWSTRTRDSSVMPYLFSPLLGLLPANAIDALPHFPANWLAFACAYVIGAAFAFRWQDDLILHKHGRHQRLQGDRVTLFVLMLIFFSNLAAGVVSDLAPQFRQMILVTVAFAGVTGACSGSFAGRALRVLSRRRRAIPPP